jgi:hypothetical protein
LTFESIEAGLADLPEELAKAILFDHKQLSRFAQLVVHFAPKVVISRLWAFFTTFSAPFSTVSV